MRRLWISLAVLASGLFYVPFEVLTGSRSLFGWDYMLLHMRRLTFARAAILHGHLPAWYSREMMGSPFLANLQDFPWTPTHLAMLLFPPQYAYAPEIAMLAMLAAWFTYLFSRRLGMSRIGAIAAGATFACAGSFAVKVITGNLSILEGYPALPLLLLLADRAISSERARDLIWLALGTACVVVAGHPQLPAYAVGAAGVYLMWRKNWKAPAAMALGIGATMIVWWPMLLLIRRSTRVLALDPAWNDIALPAHRLLELLNPGIDGWPAGVKLAGSHPLASGLGPAFFWDTFTYVGWLPIAALVIFCIAWLMRRWKPDPRVGFLCVIGAAALIGSMAFLDPLRSLTSMTIFRSPARLLYIVTFALAILFGVAIDCVLRSRWRIAVIALLALQAWDIGHISRLFLLPSTYPEPVPQFETILQRELGDGRVAVSHVLSLGLLDRYDDAGGYDSIFLANTYQWILAANGGSPKLNEEVIDASLWKPGALEEAGVKFVITWDKRNDLELAATAPGLNMYRVAHPKPRADAGYFRVSSDEIVLLGSGSVHLREAFDPGWSAKIDGASEPIRQDGFGMTMDTPPGEHEIRLRYRTPGKSTGAMISAASVLLLALLSWKTGRAKTAGLASQ